MRPFEVTTSGASRAAIGRRPQRAPTGAPIHYERHRGQTTLYRLVQQHAASFIAHTEASTGSQLPRFLKDKFDAFLECGILAHGWFPKAALRGMRAQKAAGLQLQASRFCPYCGARRMSETAAHLVSCSRTFGPALGRANGV